jgi:hypothetical protein
MTWFLIAVAGVLAWLSVASFFLALCRQASRADQEMAGHGRENAAYFKSRDSRRSLSSLPSV